MVNTFINIAPYVLLITYVTYCLVVIKYTSIYCKLESKIKLEILKLGNIKLLHKIIIQNQLIPITCKIPVCEKHDKIFVTEHHKIY